MFSDWPGILTVLLSVVNYMGRFHPSNFFSTLAFVALFFDDSSVPYSDQFVLPWACPS